MNQWECYHLMEKWAKGFEYSSQKRKYTWKDAMFYPQEQCRLLQPGTVLICPLADLLAQGYEKVEVSWCFHQVTQSSWRGCCRQQSLRTTVC